MKGLGLPLIAVLLVSAVLGVQLAAGGGHYVPRRPANPCTPRPVPPIPADLESLAERIVLSGLDHAACRLGISRERLVLALADTHPLDPGTPAALKTGLRDAIDQLDINRLVHQLGDPRRLESTVRSAILRAALSQILDRLRP